MDLLNLFVNLFYLPQQFMQNNTLCIMQEDLSLNLKLKTLYKTL